MPEMYMIIAQEIFSRFFLEEGGTAPAPPVSYAYGCMHKCVKMSLRPGLRHGPRSGSLQRSPDPLPKFQEGGGKMKGLGGEGRGKDRMEGKGKGKGNEGKGRRKGRKGKDGRKGKLREVKSPQPTPSKNSSYGLDTIKLIVFLYFLYISFNILFVVAIRCDRRC